MVGGAPGRRILTVSPGTLTDQNADFYLVQEVDIDSTRSYHVDEREPLYAALSGKTACSARTTTHRISCTR